MHVTWDQMIDPQNPFFTGTMWENIGPDGTATEARTSLAHGWASGPTPILTGYVLGVQPVKPGYQTFTVTPHPGSLRWAEGTIPTPYGQIRVRWTRDGHRFSLRRGASPVHGLHPVAGGATSPCPAASAGLRAPLLADTEFAGDPASPPGPPGLLLHITGRQHEPIRSH